MKLKQTFAWVAVVTLGFALDLACMKHLAAQSKPKTETTASAEQRFPDVIGAKVRMASTGKFDFDVTLSSPYDTPERYADAFRIRTFDGKVLGERILWHDHQNEQPFTRDLYGVSIPSDIKKVIVQARDKKHGYGGKTMEVTLPRR
ncbi:MAG: hypothetical protein HC765_09665 [Brachymonas sp.]|nr:hypothetical protein [Brachymonas sp.]